MHTICGKNFSIFSIFSEKVVIYAHNLRQNYFGKLACKNTSSNINI